MTIGYGNLWRSFLRFRHSKGFGVHSPYAFRFVNNVVRPGIYRYYSEENLEIQLRDHSRKNRKLATFIFRCSKFLNSQRILSYGLPEFIINALSASCGIPVVGVTDNADIEIASGDLVIFFHDNPASLDFNASVESEIAIIAIFPDESFRNIIEKPLNQGLLLKDKEISLLIPRKEMAYTAYDMKLCL